MTTAAAPSALAYSPDNCTVGRAMAVLGERWTVIVIREVFNGVRRFDDMRARTAIPRQVLTDRLRLLVAEGVLAKVPYQVTGQRPRHEYRLTQKGLDLYPVMVAIAEWGNRYLADPEGPPVQFVHRGCGAEVHQRFHCEDGHEFETVRDVVPQPGPGARLRASNANSA